MLNTVISRISNEQGAICCQGQVTGVQELTRLRTGCSKDAIRIQLDVFILKGIDNHFFRRRSGSIIPYTADNILANIQAHARRGIPIFQAHILLG